MKKIIIGILTSLMVLTFCGCADSIEREQRTDSESKHEMVIEIAFQNGPRKDPESISGVLGTNEK